ncbi:3-deoxy-D-manno-octulosonic acid transferase [Roseivivax marinus]|uniref:3-deoxy-D-manno-octulosonic acid transferase n=1 Tax=Roseivivax marinus TaxID=1379903 RepID=UPI00273F46CD|nr:glycosyltransferase N-terminal domain-containing protein [Roseivivax marinus]
MMLYRLLISIFAGWVLLRLALKGERTALRERLGYAPGADVPHLWLHAASNGELASARPLIEAWQRDRPDLPLVITCNSESGVALARRMGLPAARAPLDLGRAVRRFCETWQVAGHVAMESEIWPNRFACVPGPVALLGARMSEGTARTWGRFPRLARATLGRVGYASAQDIGSRERLKSLGVPAQALGPVVNLKVYYVPPQDVVPDDALRAAFPPGETWLAASTHPGEDAIVLEAHRLARQKRPDLRLILAPRHPDRGAEIASEARAAGFETARRSVVEAPEGAAVYVADTLGEMPLWYGLAGVVFIGGTLTDRGGHTPFEPAQFDAALIHGPDTRNFAAPFETLDGNGGALAIRDASGLAEALVSLGDPARRDGMARRAEELLRPEAPLDAISADLGALFPPSGDKASRASEGA